MGRLTTEYKIEICAVNQCFVVLRVNIDHEVKEN